MTIPDILALDFDGVCCDGLREYFETSRRICARVWPADEPPAESAFVTFCALRPVILSGWEMPVLLRAIVRGVPRAEILGGWERVCARLVATGSPSGDALITRLGHALDEVRREWIAADEAGWLALHAPYGSVDELRRLVAEPGRSVLVTTKEGAFARRILGSWGVRLADVQGKETGVHKCLNLRALIDGLDRRAREPAPARLRGRPPRDAPARDHASGSGRRGALPRRLGLQHGGGAGGRARGFANPAAHAGAVPAGFRVWP